MGAHVLVDDRRMARDWYLAPICRGHNHYTYEEVMWLDSRVTLVPVSVGKQ